MTDIPIIYYVVAPCFIIILILGVHLKNTFFSNEIKFPKQFYMREGYLSDVIPALRKIVTKNNKKIYVDFSEVEEMTEGSYMVFLAQVEKALILGKSIRFLPKLPKSKLVINILSTQKNSKYKHQNIRISGDIIPDKANTYNLLDPDYIDDVVYELKKLGFTEYYKPFYDYLVELMGNATEHGIRHKNINWWMLKYRDYSERCMKYVFVDMGVGIIKSYEESGLLKKYFFKSKKQIPLDALNGKLGSSTRKPNRGRGLPQIREIIEKGYISNFILITNGVSLRYINNEFVVSENPNFIGTYYSWTINKENFIRWKSTQ
jgi:hypothetical protein